MIKLLIWMWLVFPLNIFLNAKTFYTYIPEDRIGDFRVYIDDLRYVRASWKGVNLLHKWGEIYTPISWGFLKGQSYRDATIYQPDNLSQPIIAYYVPDIPVRVTKSENRVEYLWGFSFNHSDFTRSHIDNLVYPKITRYNHLQADFQQINRLEISPYKITLISTLKFLYPPGKNIYFYPVLFPGTGRDRKYLPELRILGKDVLVINKNNQTRMVKYPSERVAKIWLDDEPRSLIFNLEGIGKVRYNFSFSDPAVSLVFFSHTGWPTPSLNPYGCPAIVGKITLPTEKLQNSSYECTMKMEVIVGDAVNDLPILQDTSDVLALEQYLDVKVASENTSYRYFVDEPVKFHIVVDGLKNNTLRNFEVELRVLDYSNQQVHQQILPLVFPRDINKPLEVFLPIQDKGTYILVINLLEDNKIVASKAQRFCIIDRPVEYPAEKSFFGCANGFIRFPGVRIEDVRDTISLLHDLGIKKLRWWEHWTVDWAKVEKEPGKYTFPARFEKLEISRELGMDNFLASGSFEGGSGFMPEWYKSGKKTLYGYDLPKDFQSYQDYCYQIAKRFDGLINEFELENEPNYVKPENTAQAKEYLIQKAEILSAAYRGIKKAQPDAVVIAGTVGITGLKDLKWLEELLEYSESRNLKLMDVMAPHYLLRSGVKPEDSLEIINYARDIAKRYNLILWNGEDGRANDSPHSYQAIYPNYEFIELEKSYTNISVREHLLQKAYGVQHVNLCWAVSWNPPLGIPTFEYESSQIGVFWGRGGFLKPWAVAYSVLANLLEGTAFDQKVDIKNIKDLWCLIFTRSDSAVAAIWLKEGKGQLDLSLPCSATHINIVGNTKKVQGRMSFEVTEEPFYLVVNIQEKLGLIKALQKSQFIPENVIALGEIKFSKDKKAMEVLVTNFSSEPIKLNALTLSYGKEKLVLNDVVLPGNTDTTLQLKMPQEVKNSLLVKVDAVVGDKTFSKEEFVFFPSLQSARAMGYLIAVKAKTPVNIDGDLREWNYAIPIVLNRENQVLYQEMKALDLGRWKGPDDLSATGYLMWDEENLYFACKVTDDIWSNSFPKGFSSTWNCDSIQIALDPLMDNKTYENYYNEDDQEINLALTQKGPVYWRRTFGTKYEGRRTILPDGQVPGAKLAIKQWEKGLIYEFSIPVKELYPLDIKGGVIGCRFNFIVNDDDGGGRRQWIGITPGIGEKKAPHLYKKVFFSE